MLTDDMEAPVRAGSDEMRVQLAELAWAEEGKGTAGCVRVGGPVEGVVRFVERGDLCQDLFVAVVVVVVEMGQIGEQEVAQLVFVLGRVLVYHRGNAFGAKEVVSSHLYASEERAESLANASIYVCEFSHGNKDHVSERPENFLPVTRGA